LASAQPGGVRLLLVVGGLAAYGPASMDGYIPGLPEVARQLGASTSLTQFTVTAFLLGIAGGHIVFGSASDVLGRRRPLFAGLAVYIAAGMLCAVAPTIEVLIGARFVQGVAASAGIVLSRAIIRDLYAGAEAARHLSRLILVMGLAPILAPVVGGQLLRVTSWRGIFVALAGLGLALLVGAVLTLPETLPPERRRPAELGTTFRSFGGLLRDRVFRSYALLIGFGTGTIICYIAGSPFVLQEVYGASPQLYSVIFGAIALGMVTCSQINAALVMRHSPRRLLRLGVTMNVVAGIGLVVVVLAGLGMGAVVACLALLFGSWGFVPANATALALTDHPRIAGAASALLGLAQYGVGALVAPLVGAAGKDSAWPMALAICAFGLASALAVRAVSTRTRAAAVATAGREPVSGTSSAPYR
jgi:DHA1 family bicyclomycin/chloramphenicol resistance-like MFS transporter